MSTPSARRMKERGGGGAAKVTAAPAGKISPVAGKSISTGKENPRPTSRVRSATPKPNVPPMVRMDKTVVVPPVEPRTRWSSSVPRGRSSSPSEFTRILSDLRKNSSRVSMGPPQIKRNCAKLKGLSQKSGEKPDIEERVLIEMETRVQEKEKVENRASNYVISHTTDEKLISVPPKKSDGRNNLLKDIKRNAGNLEEFERILKGSSHTEEQNSNLIPKEISDLENFHEQSNLESVHKSNKVSEEVKMKSCTVGVHKSKLREKLAFLEGRVNKISSDINKTKEMLDLNNLDASKTVLSDIQEKITGIEKVMVHVDRDGDCDTLVVVKCKENKVTIEEKEVAVSKSSVRGLSVEELEARLFPHRKLLRDRTLSKSTCNSDVKISSLDENDIAGEFLASLSKEEYREEIEIQETDEATTYVNAISRKYNFDEKIDEFVDPAVKFVEAIEENDTNTLSDIGCKTSTGGWFVSEGDSVLLAHDDGSCSFYDIANCEKKAEYKPPSGILPNTWRDCWLIRAPDPDGCSGRYIVAATAGNSTVSGFCSWDFHTKDIRAFHSENEPARVRTPLAPLSNNTAHGRNALSTGDRQCWYKPCGPLIVSTSTCRRTVRIFDIRDGEQVMTWDLQNHAIDMDHSCPLHWKNRGKVVIAESDGVSLWDVNSISSHALLSVSSSGRKISALHVNNSDAELGGGVRQRISSLEAEGSDGVFCTLDSINVLDFRNPSGIALTIPKIGTNAHSVFSSGDNIYVGCSSLKSAGQNNDSSQIQQFSLRKQKIFSTYIIPESNAHHDHDELKASTQVWGNSNIVMGVSRLGLFVFDSIKDDALLPPFTMDYDSSVRNAKEVIGPNDMCYPSFDYSASRILLISKDRPARWRYLSEVI